MSLPRLGVDLDSDNEDNDVLFLSKQLQQALGGVGVGVGLGSANAGGSSAAAASGGGGGGDAADLNDLDGLSEFPTYEDYLDAQILPEDMKYLESEDLMRQLVELGYRGSGEALKRDEFEARKRELAALKASSGLRSQKVLASAGRTYLPHYPFLQALADREEMVRNGKLTSIIFIRDKNHKGQEVSGYIDYAHRLKTEDFGPIFARKKKLLPKPSDLSYYNWETQTSTSNPTPNFQVKSDSESGLLFKNKRDRKVINVDPNAENGPGDNSTRHVIKTKEYIQVVIIDHMTRRKA